MIRAVLALGLLRTGWAAAPEKPQVPPPQPPPADSVRTFEHPSDDGFTINLEWGRSKDEGPDIHYVVEIASEEDYRAGRFRRVATIPSRTHLRSEAKRLRDYDDPLWERSSAKLHYLAIHPVNIYPPDRDAIRDRVEQRERARRHDADDPDDNFDIDLKPLLAQAIAQERLAIRARPYYLRLAIFRMEKRTEKQKKPRGPAAEPKKKREEEKPPVLLRARIQSRKFLEQLDAFDGAVTQVSATLDPLGHAQGLARLFAAKRPTVRERSYLPDLSAIDSQILATIGLHDQYLDALRELDRALAAGRDVRQELQEWEERQREAAQKAAEELAEQLAQPKDEEEVEVEVEEEGEPAYVTDGGQPKVVAARAVLPELVRPDATGLRAYDRPSDKGDAIAVEWPRSPSENARTTYIVEIAEVKDGKPGRFKPAAVLPSLGADKYGQAKYFGFSSHNRKLHLAAIRPAQVFPPDRGAIRRETVEAELKLMSEAMDPDTDFPRHVAALASSVAAYRDGVRALAPPLDALAGPLAPPLEQLDPPFLTTLTDYSAYATKLARFESHIAKQVTKRTDRSRKEISRKAYASRVSIRRYGEKLYLGTAAAPKEVVASARVNWFKGFKVNNLIYSLVFCAIVGVFIQIARRNPNLFIRKIAGLEAVEEAIGRATEMGRSVFFVHGLTDVGSLSTIAALNVLGRVARRAAEYDTRVRVMNRDPIVMAVSQEVVKQSYTEAGRPDAYNDDDVALVASDQFSYVAAVGGRMVRERPAAIFLMGYFYAESLLLAETGASTGAIQIAGTDSYTQIPFFITTCDYTLIGEELYAASAYLSREPRMLGSLRGQDVGKAVLMAVMLIFTGLATLGALLAAKAPGFGAFIDYWVKTLCQPFS